MSKSVKLTELAIKETSGVDHPAHLHEGWLVMKSENGLDDSLNQIIDTDNQEIIVELQATPEVEEVMDEVTEELPTVEVTEVAASVDGPDLVAKELTDLRKEIALVTEANKALVLERELEKAATSAHQWAILPGLNPIEFAKVLVQLRSLDSKVAETVEEILTKSSVALSEAGVFTELGSDGGEDSSVDAYGQIMAKAHSMVDGGEVSSLSKAISVVAKTEPHLYAEYVAGKRAV